MRRPTDLRMVGVIKFYDIRAGSKQQVCENPQNRNHLFRHLRLILSISGTLKQFAKSQEFSNVRALQIFECKVLFPYKNKNNIVEQFTNAIFVRQIASQNLQRKNLRFSETVI